MAESDENKPDPDENKPDPEPTGKTPEQELADIKAALKKANKEAEQRRKELDTLRKAQEDENEKAIREAKEQATNETAAQWRRRVAKAEARAAFGDKGSRFANMVDLDSLEVDEDGKVTGLEDQVKSIKADFPEVFDPKNQAARTDVDGSDKGDSGDGTKSSAEVLAGRLAGE